MRLERLEISGFKSFSDRSELSFDQGVTAIVGPNGCGKSNVADAITWVLGEQSAKSLRGDKMEDVIFNGSDARRPGGTAEVSLRLTGLAALARGDEDPLIVTTGPHAPFSALETAHDELGSTEYRENGTSTIAQLARAFTRDVEVTRRLYRSGESEYLIDGEVCRLRDIHDLLMDTGLGAKAYSIIEQGKIGMILSTRPTDRRQLIEEAAGITRYKSRRRAAELKLEAAQQNLTRIDDIVFEVEKQRGALKRQAAKARRYRRLRDELRRWEMVLIARRYRELARHIEALRAQLGDVRERESVAAARVAEFESTMARLRIEQAEADQRGAAIREDAHARELDIARRQQQQAFDRQQAEMLAARADEIAEEVRDLEARREPTARALEMTRQAVVDAAEARIRAAESLAFATGEHTHALSSIVGLEASVDAARATVFATLNSATALRHAIAHATHQLERTGELLSRLDVEADDAQREAERCVAEHETQSEALARARVALEQIRVDRMTREAELGALRARHDEIGHAVKMREHALAAMSARLASLEEVAGSRAEFSDAARMVLVQANGHVGQQGAVADFLEVETRYERAVEACLGDLLQHVIVERHDQAAAGLSIVREQDAGRCGFVVVDPGSNGYHPREALRRPGIVPVSDVMRIQGPHAFTIGKVVSEAYIAESFEQAVALSRETSAPIATLSGEVLRGPHLVTGGAKAESRGILTTRREIKELRERLVTERETLARQVTVARDLDVSIASATSAILSLQERVHELQVAIVGQEAQVERVSLEQERIEKRTELIRADRMRAEQERAELDARRVEAEGSLTSLGDEHRDAETELQRLQSALAESRTIAAASAGRAAEVGATHAALAERASAAMVEVARLETASAELDARIAARRSEADLSRGRRMTLLAAVEERGRALDSDVRGLGALRDELRIADEASGIIRERVETHDSLIREARREADGVRAAAADLDVRLATAESDRTHLAQSSVDAVQAPIDDVLAAVEALERDGQDTPDAAAIVADDGDPEADDDELVGAPALPTPSDETPAVMTAEDAIARLRTKIERLGPVNMIAIEQFDELEARHAFLAAQRKDLTESIQQTTEAIARIDETTRARFAEAFAAIQQNFQKTFTTLFGGGRAGLTLLDESDPLDSGIDIVASPPGKRLQSVQLLSGGEKALTAIALMFAIFQYKPSPFCLLDEIDAPLDDANVGRFVDMLKGMLDRTQFILITHNRRTMEIADRLYGVTMEEPGVSKLISLHLH